MKALLLALTFSALGITALAQQPGDSPPTKTDAKPTRKERRALREKEAAEAAKGTAPASKKVQTPKPTKPPLIAASEALPAGTTRLDFYLLIGQSNMKGRGFMPEEPANDPRIRMMHLKDDHWYVARHPLHLSGDAQTFAGADNAGVGPGLAFAQAMAAADPAASIGLIPSAVGGTEIARWQKGADLYENALRRARLAVEHTRDLGGHLKGVLWLQGEADASPDKLGVYAEKLQALVDALRTDLQQPALPFLCATIAETRADRPGDSKHQINEILLALPQKRPHTACVDARDLKATIGDGVHYDTASQEEIGKRFATLLLKYTHSTNAKP